MNAKQKRETAIRAARAQLRSMSAQMTVENAESVLDDLCRSQPQLVAARWWQTASDNQVRLFRQEWRQWNQ